MGLGDPGGDGPDPDLGHQLDVDAGPRVRVLEVVDELRQVLDRVDVVMGRRRDQPHRRCRVAHLGDPGIDLAARQLAALAGLRALGHLDLEIVGAGEVLAGHAEASRGHLLDGAAARIAVGIEPVARRVLAALAGVGPGAHAVHGDGQGLVGLLADGSVGHGAGREALDDRLDGLDLLERHRRGRRFQLEKPAERREVLALLVHEARVFLEDLVLPAAGRVLEAEHGLRIEQVVLAVAPPLVLPAPVEVGLAGRALGVGVVVAQAHLLRDHVDPDPADPRGGPGEVLVDDRLVEPHGLEDLRAAIGLDGRDPHLGGDLEHAFVERLDVVLDGGLVVEARDQPLADQVIEGLEGEVGVDGPRAIADQDRHVVDLARLAALQDQTGLDARALAHQVVVDPGGREQGRDRGQVLVHPAIGEDEVGATLGDGTARLFTNRGERALQSFPALGHRIEDGDGAGAKPRQGHVADAGQLFVVQDGALELQETTALRSRIEEITLGPDGGLDLGDQLLADPVERRVRHLGEELLEVVVQEPRTVREHRQRGVGAHRADRLLAVPGHGAHDEAQVLVGVAEELLAPEDGSVIGLGHVGWVRERRDRHDVLVQPLAIRVLHREGVLELGVVDDPALAGIDQEDPAGMQALLDEHVLGRHVQDPDLRGHDDEPVLGHVIAGRPKPVAVEHGADHRAVGEGDGGRAVPGFHETAVIFIEGLALIGHGLVPAPGLGDHHEYGVRERPAGHVQELQHVVEAGRVAAVLVDDGEDLLEVLAEER